MFDAKRGENIARSIYDDAFMRTDVELWYEYYTPISCWDAFITEDIQTYNNEAVTNLIAWLVSAVGIDAETIFKDGATWSLACALDAIYGENRIGE